MTLAVWRACAPWALALGGCTAFDVQSFDQSFDRTAGWHLAQVVAVGRAGDLAASADRDCGTNDGDAAARYAIVRYRSGGVHSRSLGTGRWAAGTGLEVGDTVYVNILDCAVPLALPGQRGSVSGAPSR
jgi:hypothetical protein